MLKCALISGAGMGLRHGNNFHNHPDAEVVAVCEMNPDLLAKATEQYGVPGYTSLDDMLANCDPDLVLLIVNETRRIPPLRQLIAAGRNVFTEKPLCGLEGQNRVKEADAAIAAPAIEEWRESSLKFGIDFNYRFMTHFRKLHEDAVEGRLGNIRMVRARAHYACWSHVIDQILWTMGRPEWVSAMGNPNESGGWQRMIHMQWPNGVIGALDGSEMWGWDDAPLRIMIVGDKTRLQRVVANMLDNAIKYSPSGAEIKVSAKDDDSNIVLTITDNGTGIDEKEIPKIFKRFYREDKSRTAPGNGLGLSLALAIVKAHGGEIHVESKVGSGTTFSIIFPKKSSV